MTEKFKKAVKDVVADGIVTPEEEALILNLAKEEGISENDALIYLAGEKKKANKPSFKDNIKPETIISTLAILVPAAVTIIAAWWENKNDKKN